MISGMATAADFYDYDEDYDQGIDLLSARKFGCSHYKRKAKIVAPCCSKVYSCRLCHDEKERHPINRKEIIELVCAFCDTRQFLQERCKACGLSFGKYTCLSCRMFDDEDKGQFHCMKCTICRVGGIQNFYHCSRCDMCIATIHRIGHKCLENASHSDCPVCLEDIHGSRISAFIPSCGHLLHEKCKNDLIESGRKCCPLCQKDF